MESSAPSVLPAMDIACRSGSRGEAELAALYSRRYVDRLLAYHAGIFRALIAAGELQAEDPDTLAMQYVAPVLTLIGICDRQPEREAECLDMLRRHVALFFRMVHKREPLQ